MPAQLNHTIVYATDAAASAAFLSSLLGLAPPARVGRFHVVAVANGVSLDFADTSQSVSPQHYAFLVTEAEFDQVFVRVQEMGLDYWADPARSRPGEINHRQGGRGVYFPDPDGHVLEVLTRP